MSRYAALLKPLQIRHLTIRNRIMSTAHTSGASEDGKPKERYQRYHEEKARGGIGLTMIGGSTAIAVDTPGADMLHLDASSDDIVPFYQQLAARVHKHGARVFGQIAHMGRRANWDNQHWLSPVSPSRVREPAHRSFPKEMEDWDIRRLVRAFGAAAARARAGGLDGLELSATHGHLLDQFWSPRVNQRTDQYGGTLERRLRFTFEVLDAVREAVGEDFIVGLRMSGDELFDGGLEPQECIEIARRLTARGHLDYLSVLAGQAENLPSHTVVFPGMTVPAGPFLRVASAIKANVGVPVFHAQRMTDLASAARAVEDGHVDMVAMTRAHFADPHIVRKLMEGREDEIRPCIGANYCIDRLYSGGQAYCLHNAATGREVTMPHVQQRARTRRKVVIVGGGPAGLEAARVTAERGHEVVLFEAASSPGGQVAIAAKAPGRESLLMITRWLTAQVQRQRVDLRLGRRAQSADILAERPDVVIVATGGLPARPPLDGAEHAVTAWQILTGEVATAGNVLVFDDNGAEPAMSCADFLSQRGAKVELVTADPSVGPRLERTTRPVFLRALYERAVVFTPDTRLVQIYPEVGADGKRLIAVLRNEYTDAEEERAVDQIVVEYGTTPVEDLYLALKPLSRNLGEVDLERLVRGEPQSVCSNDAGAFDLYRVGDAVSNRNIHAAIYESLRLCKDL